MVIADPAQDRWLELKVVCDREAVPEVTYLFARYGFKRHVVTEVEPLKKSEDPRFTDTPGKQVSVSSALNSGDMTSSELEDIRNSLWVVRQNIWVIGRSHTVSPLELFERGDDEWENSWKDD